MRDLTQYGRLAEQHWRQFLPGMVADLNRQGRLREMLVEAEERTVAELDSLRRHFRQQGLTAQEAQDRAWEIVRERYIFLPPET